MPYFKKRPDIVEAREFTNDSAKDIIAWSNGAVVRYGTSEMYLVIYSSDGEKTASLGDWIVKDVDGSFYPVHRTLFIQTYKRV